MQTALQSAASSVAPVGRKDRCRGGAAANSHCGVALQTRNGNIIIHRAEINGDITFCGFISKGGGAVISKWSDFLLGGCLWVVVIPFHFNYWYLANVKRLVENEMDDKSDFVMTEII